MIHPVIGKYYYKKFIRTFKISFNKLESEYGFRLIRFQTHIGVPKNVSCRSFLIENYGMNALYMVLNIMFNSFYLEKFYTPNIIRGLYGDFIFLKRFCERFCIEEDAEPFIVVNEKEIIHRWCPNELYD